MFTRLLPVVFMVLLWTWVQPSQASAVSLQIADLNFTGCAGNQLTGSYRIEVLDGSGAILNATTPYNVQRTYWTPSGVETFSGLVTSGLVLNINVVFSGDPNPIIDFLANLVDDPSVASSLYRYDCLTGQVSVSAGADDRINRARGDLVAALYVRADREGRPVIRVYNIIASSEGVFAGDFTYDLIEPYLNNPPSRNLKLQTIGKVTLYALTTGEFQVNIGPDAQGKTYVLIWRGFPPRSLYGYTLIP
jgi:hypothetical protein